MLEINFSQPRSYPAPSLEEEPLNAYYKCWQNALYFAEFVKGLCKRPGAIYKIFAAMI